MKTGEVVDTALRLYQQSAWLILQLTAVPVVLCYAAAVFVETVVLPGLLTGQANGRMAEELSELVAVLLVGLLVAGPLFSLGLGWASGIVVNISRALLHGTRPNRDEAKSVGASAMLAVSKALGLTLLYCLIGILISGVFMLIGMLIDKNGLAGEIGAAVSSLMAVMALVFGLVAFPVAWNARSLVPVITVIEQVPAKVAMKRSKGLMGYQRGHPSGFAVTVSICGIMLLVGLPLWYSLRGVMELMGVSRALANVDFVPGFGQMLEGMVLGVPTFVSLWLLLPLWSTAMTVLYYDRIVRLEAYDVSLILEDIKNESRRSVLLR